LAQVDSVKLGQNQESALIVSDRLTLAQLLFNQPLKPYTTGATPNIFSPAAASTLQLSDNIVARALDIARDNAISRAFGDFDDHLENVTIDWLKNGTIQDALTER
jgi:hypothetical protein